MLRVSKPANPELYYPLLINAVTHEPYLRLPPPHSNIILTPPRASDAADMVPHLNDPAVHHWLTELPSPYTVEHATSFLEGHSMKCTSEALKSVEEANGRPGFYVSGLVVNSIREVQDDGTDVYLGNLTMRRCHFMQFCPGASMEDKERLEEENDKRPVGDPEILWTFGNYLAPSHHRRGITTAVLKTLLNEWAIPKMGVRKIQATAFKGNYGSVKVMENNGFKWRELREGVVRIHGDLRDLNILDWEYSP